MIDKQCLFCGSELKGRSDKKFCNDFCRNNYNNSRTQSDIDSSPRKVFTNYAKVIEENADAYIQVMGDSMRLTFKEGSILALREIKLDMNDDYVY